MENLSLSHKGVLVILSSPSGAGKTSIARALVEENKNLLFSCHFLVRAHEILDHFLIDDLVTNFWATSSGCVE